MTATALLYLLVGLGAGAALGRQFAQRRANNADAAPVRQALEAERGRLASERDAMALRAHAAETACAAADATLAAERAAAADKQADLEGRFQLLAREVMKQNEEAFLTVAEQRLELSRTQQVHELDQRAKAIDNLVKPLAEQLEKVERSLEATEHRRTRAFATLEEQLRSMGETGSLLRVETEQLKNALRRPEVRGAWGELQLKRVAELGGMLERCDFDTQHSVDGDDGKLRPDMVVRLAGGRNLVVDAKVSLGSYFDAINADGAAKEAAVASHARHVRTHIDQLSAKAYWEKLSPTPEFVVAFIPGEAMLAQALEADSSLIEYAAQKRVMLAGPVSLILMMRTAAYAWTETDFADNARKVFDEGRELHKRLGKMGDHLERLGRSLTGSVKAYNETIGSLERQVLPSARRMRDLKVTEAVLTSPSPVEEPIRALGAVELVESADSARRVRALPTLTGVEVIIETDTELDLDERTIATVTPEHRDTPDPAVGANGS